MRNIPHFLIILIFLSYAQILRSHEAFTPSNKDKAAQFLDHRAELWLNFPRAQQYVEGENQTVSCFACHTTHTYTAVRPLLPGPGSQNDRIFDNIRRRIVAGLGVPPFHSEPAGRTAESRGVEAVNTSYLLALKEAREGGKTPSPLLTTALERLWLYQRADGGWDFFNFKFEPLATTESQHFTACLAAIAVGQAPGYYGPGAKVSPAVEPHVALLRAWLKKSRNPANLFGEAWLLQASVHLDGLLTAEEKAAVITKLLAAQNQAGDTKGSWTLYYLNQWKYSEAAPPAQPRDLNPEVFKPDGYATGLITFSLLEAGVPAADPALASAVQWLIRNQREDGSWRAYSLNKNRDEKTDPAFWWMSDEATAWAARALLRAADTN